MQKVLIHAAEIVLLMEEKEQIRADVTEGRKTNVWGNLMHEVYAGQKVLDNKYQSRGKEQELLGPAGTTACKRELNSYTLQLLCAN